MRTNANVTLYNKYKDTTTTPPSEAYWSTQIKGVAWENRRAAVKLATGGAVKDNSVTIYIPLARDRNYLDPREWDALSNKGDNWTLRDGDIVVRGLVDDEISASFTVSDLKRKYNDVLTVSSVDLMDNGSRALSHWKVGAG